MKNLIFLSLFSFLFLQLIPQGFSNLQKPNQQAQIINNERSNPDLTNTSSHKLMINNLETSIANRRNQPKPIPLNPFKCKGQINSLPNQPYYCIDSIGRSSINSYDYRVSGNNKYNPSSENISHKATKDWTLIMSESFEGNFPVNPWMAYSVSGYTDAYWDDANCRSYAGSYSGYCGYGGYQGVNCGENYPHDMKTFMKYGPFSLEEASDALLSFYWWANTESDYDYFQVMASVDNSNFYGVQWSGDNSDWYSYTFDLTDVYILGNLCGQSQVWITFIFQSDYNTSFPEGAYVDEIELWQLISTGTQNLELTGGSFNPNPVNINESFSINTQITNSGSGPANNLEIEYYLSSDIYITSEDCYLGNDYVTLNAGQTSNETITINLSDIICVLPGTCYVGVYIVEEGEGWYWTDPLFINDIQIPDINISPTELTINQTDNSLKSTSPNLSHLTNHISDDTTGVNHNFNHGLGAIIPDSIINYWAFHDPPVYDFDPKLPLIDWRINDSPVKNQGICGSCWAFAAIAYIENLGDQVDLSEQIIVSCSNGGSCNGGSFHDALNYIKYTGVAYESCYPYLNNNGNCDDACNDPVFKERISSVSDVLWGIATVNNLKAKLQTGPLVVSMLVPDDNTFNGNPGYQGGVYNYSGGYIPESQRHAVLLVGYDDALQCFIAKNSWGIYWGEDGYFRIDYYDAIDDVQFGSYAVNGTGVYTQYLSENAILISNVGEGDLNVNSVTDNEMWLSTSGYAEPPFTINDGNFELVNIDIDWEQLGENPETGIITIGSNDPDEPTIEILVTAVPEQSYLTLNDCPSLNQPYEEGTFPLHVISNVSWTVNDDADWINCNPNSGNNNGTILVSFSQNSGSSGRTGTISIGSESLTETCTLHQDYLLPFLNLTNCPTVIQPANGGNFNLQIESNIPWNVVEDDDWVSCNPMSGNENGIVTVTYDPCHEIENRTCNIIIISEINSSSCEFTQEVFYGINQNYNNNKILFYPNPVRNTAFLKLEDNSQLISVEVFNGKGFKIGLSKYNNYCEGIFRIDMSNFSNGLYVIKCITEKGSYTKKIIVER